MNAYDGLTPLYGDLHSHCGISYGHGSLEDAFGNARERLDFVSVTGHAFWPDMPEPNDRNQQIIAFHREGFARLRRQWERVRKLTAALDEGKGPIAFLGFEMHSGADGDYTVVHRDFDGDVLYCGSLAELRERLLAVRSRGGGVLAFPHHIGYRCGHRGINWEIFSENISPFVEIISMHGCSEADEGPRPFLHTMGPSDHRGTMQYGLERGHVFGVIGSTDHHSAHPGSYGHGLGGVWARARTRDGIWDGLESRRTWAMTGDRVRLEFAVNDAPMGSIIPVRCARRLELDVAAGGAIDYVDVVRNNRLWRRFSQRDVADAVATDPIRTKVLLEVGWGPRNQRVDWDVRLGISDGRIEHVEPRFRGGEVVSPADRDAGEGVSESRHTSRWASVDPRTVEMRTVTWGNPNNVTPATQGICLQVEMPRAATVCGTVNDMEFEVPLARLLEGALAMPLAEMPAPSFRLHRAPMPEELHWSMSFQDKADRSEATYYVRVRQQNDQWAWSSPIFLRD